ncbi:MAG: tetratricopeptide repeat protein [Candidatus Sedimenticola sp. (ex Thyasira tokunagai)]
MIQLDPLPFGVHKWSMDTGKYNFFYLLLLGCLLLSTEGMAASSALQKVDALLFQGQVERAAQLCKTELERSPDNLDIRNNLGNIYLLQGRISAAQKEFEAILKQQPTYVQARNNLGLCYLRRDRPAQAVEAFRKVLDHQPDHLQGMVNLTEGLIAMGDHEEAGMTLTYALIVHTEIPSLHYRMGTLSALQGDFAEAMKRYTRALELDPRHLASLIQAGFASLALDRLEQALGFFAHANRLKPDDPNIHHGLGLCLLRQGLLDDGIDALNHSLRLRPGDDRIHAQLAQAWEQHGNYDAEGRALKHYQRALTLNPKNQSATFHLALLMEELVRKADAEQLYTTLLKLDPQHLEGKTRLALLLKGRHEYEPAAQLLAQVVEATPNNSFLKLQLAGLYKQLGRKALAVALVQDVRDGATDLRHREQADKMFEGLQADE